MDRYTKLFVKTSLIYLGLGVFLGAHLAIFEHGRIEIRFVHVHTMLLGFMAMLIYGVAYHILPRFNAKPVPYPGLIPVQYWLANIGIVGLSAFYILGGFWGTGALRVFFGLFGIMEAVAIAIFIINIYPVVSEEKPKPAVPAPSPEPVRAPEGVADTTPKPAPSAGAVKVSPTMKIAEILDQWPHLEDVFYEQGLESVANPAARSTVGKMITLSMAAKKAGKNLFELIAALEGKTLLNADGKIGASVSPKASAGGPPFDRGEMATAKTMVGRLIEVYPETKVVFEKHYGASCFTCPGQKTESVEQTAQMHGMAPQVILDEINQIIGDALKKAS
ncbi:MAG: DUF1858 domain-containing protein [Nitrospinae bacterium]|nr:DUF1858 domain-containing protein [Nitrospinota bacterium]